MCHLIIAPTRRAPSNRGSHDSSLDIPLPVRPHIFVLGVTKTTLKCVPSHQKCQGTKKLFLLCPARGTKNPLSFHMWHKHRSLGTPAVEGCGAELSNYCSAVSPFPQPFQLLLGLELPLTVELMQNLCMQHNMT